MIEERLVRKEMMVREDIQGQKALKELLAGRDKKVNKEIAKIRLQNFYRFCYDQSILLILLIMANLWAWLNTTMNETVVFKLFLIN